VFSALPALLSTLCLSIILAIAVKPWIRIVTFFPINSDYFTFWPVYFGASSWHFWEDLDENRKTFGEVRIIFLPLR